MIIPLCATCFIFWADYGRVQHENAVSAIGSENAVVDPLSPTGYTNRKRWLIVPEHNNHSFQWIAETQQMFAQGEWRVRRVDYENTPYGREVHSASPYRWWLGLIAWCDHIISGRSIGLSVERAALWADPLLHFIFLIGATIFTARLFGAFPATLLSLGLATIFPLAAAFLPGVPDYYSLSHLFAFGSVLLLLAGLRAFAPSVLVAKETLPETARPQRRAARWFCAAGLAGGCGLWISAADQVPIVEGIALGALVAACVARMRAKAKGGDDAPPLPWREWALAGATTCLLAYLIEYFPSHMDMRLRVNHPLYGLAWIGVGELLRWFTECMRRGKLFTSSREIVVGMLAIAAVAALPIAMAWSETQSFFAGDVLATRMTNLPDGIVADNFRAWIDRDGFTANAAASCLPILILGPAVWALFRRGTDIRQRTTVAIALGPVIVALAFALKQLHWWSVFDSVGLVLLIAAITALPRRSTFIWSGVIGFIFILGLIQIVPRRSVGEQNKLTKLEVIGLYERALSHWIADHAGSDGVVILAPPDFTTSSCFYGPVRGLGTQNWENRDGISATFRIATATKPEEALALISQRGVTHIVLPSWDPDLDVFARMGLKRPEDSFIFALHRWVLFNWLRPLPYKLPTVAGLEGQTVALFQVTEEADRATAISRLTEYFLEMQQIDFAIKATEALRRYPADLGALLAIAQVEKANGNAVEFTKVFNAILSSLTTGSDGELPWDRRTTLAVVLALGGRHDLSRVQVQRCLAEIDEAQIRLLTTGTLYHLQVLIKAFDLKIGDEHLRKLALELLPVELQSRL